MQLLDGDIQHEGDSDRVPSTIARDAIVLLGGPYTRPHPRLRIWTGAASVSMPHRAGRWWGIAAYGNGAEAAAYRP